MTNKSRLQANNENLQSLIDKANQLPDAGGGGGSDGSIETCTVTVSDSNNRIATLVYQNNLNETKKVSADPMTSAAGTYTVVCGTLLYFQAPTTISSITVNNLTGSHMSIHNYLYLVTAKAGENADLIIS